MTDNIVFQLLIAFIAVLPGTIGAIASCIFAWRSSQSAQQAVDLTQIGNDKVDRAGARTDELHKTVNGRLDQLLQAARTAAYAEGLAEGLRKAIEEKSQSEATMVAAVMANSPPQPPKTESAEGK